MEVIFKLNLIPEVREIRKFQAKRKACTKFLKLKRIDRGPVPEHEE